MSTKYGICITHEKGKVGWIVGKNSDVMLFETKQEATKVLSQMKKDDRYSWNCVAEVAAFDGFRK